MTRNSTNAASCWLCRYRLLHCVRLHVGADDAAYGCVYQREDEAGQVGAWLSPKPYFLNPQSPCCNAKLLRPYNLELHVQGSSMYTDLLISKPGGVCK